MNTKYAYTLEEKTEVTVVKTVEKKHYIKLGGAYGCTENFIIVTEEQLKVLEYLDDNGYFEDWEEIDPTQIFEEL